MNRRQLGVWATNLLLLGYYLLVIQHTRRAGFYTPEALFLAEKGLLVWQSAAAKITVLGLTYPVVPFLLSLPLVAFGAAWGPVLASALGMTGLFHLVMDDFRRRQVPWWLALGVGLTFVLHPGFLYAATSGRSVYAVLLFGYLFFRSIFEYYRSNTTYHVSLASLFLVGLVFSSFEFIWLTLFLLPLVWFISLQGLSVRGGQTVFQLGLAFNNASVRRKLLNRTLALLVVLFALPLAGLVLFGLLNRVYANDPQYFRASPYANWQLLTQQVLRTEYGARPTGFLLSEAPLSVTLRRLLYAPLLGLVGLAFRGKAYQLLTLLSPLALVEFLHLKNPTLPLPVEFYLLFVVMAWAAWGALPLRRLRLLSGLAAGLMAAQVLTGFFQLRASVHPEERHFAALLTTLPEAGTPTPVEPLEMANALNRLPPGSRVLTDDATAYPVVAMSNNVRRFVLPNEPSYVAALQNPAAFAQYLLLHEEAVDPLARYSLTNEAYGGAFRRRDATYLRPVYATERWHLYQLKPPEPR
jgi:hypothetical protein